MHPFARLLAETGAVAAAALAFGLAGNALHPDGLSLTRDYFLARTPEPETAGGSTDGGVRERLAQAGLAVVEHDEVVALFRDELYEAEAYVFVDARNDESFSKGHIPGAHLFDHYRPERTIDAVMDVCSTAQRIVVYCYGKDCTDSELAAQHLVRLGVDRALIGVYVGGFQEWQAAGLPVDAGAPGAPGAHGEESGDGK
jgi:rhodanese-related sulfurtransferase